MPISHKNIPDSELHNPKGFAAAGNNSVSKKNSAGNLEWSTVDTDDIAGAAVTNDKMAPDSVGSTEIVNDSVTSDKLATDSVLTDAIKIRTDTYSVDCGVNDFDEIDVSSTGGSIITVAYEPDTAERNATTTLIITGATTLARVFYPSTSGSGGPTGETGTLYITYIASS